MAKRGILRTSVIVVLLGLLAALTTPVGGQVEENKSFTVDVNDDVVAGDADAVITVTITNTSKHQRLGSANVTVPQPFVVVAAPDDGDPATTDVLELRNLRIAPGGSRDFDVTVGVQTCAPQTSDPFTVAAKQSNAFRGEGNDFFLDAAGSDLTAEIVGTCSLEFVAEPGDAERDATITSVDYDPTGPPVTVRIVDAGGSDTATHSTTTVNLTARNPNVLTPLLDGTTSAAAVDGVATFAPGPTLSPSAFDYTLEASADFDADSSTDATVASEPLDIVDDQVVCEADQSCEATVARDGQRVTAAFGPDPPETAPATSLIVSLGAGDVPDFTCEGVAGDRAVAQYFFVGGDASMRTGTLSLTFPAGPDEPADHHHHWTSHHRDRPRTAYDICWAASYEFATDGNGQSSEQGTTPDGQKPLNVGVLPDCAKYGAPTRPCVSDRTVNQRDKTVTIVIAVDGRDPWARS